MTFALDFYPNIPWLATLFLCIVAFILPFLISRYRTLNWKIPIWHLLAMILLALIMLFDFHKFQKNWHQFDEINFLWEQGMLGQAEVNPKVFDQIEYSSILLIAEEFLIFNILPPVFLSLILGMITFWITKFFKKDAIGS